MKENERTPSYAVHLHLIVAVIYTLSYENGEKERVNNPGLYLNTSHEILQN